MADEAKEEITAESTPKSNGTGKVLIFSGAGLGGIIGAAFLFATFAVPVVPEEVGGGTASDSSEAEGAADRPQQVFNVPVILINVKSTNMKRILKFHINLLYESEDEEVNAGYFETKLPAIKDTLNTLLSEKTLEELEGKEAKNLLRIELMDELNRVVFPGGQGEIQKIYYEEFIVQ